MYVLRAVLELMLAMFAVFGLYSAARLLMQKLFGDKRIMYAIASSSTFAVPNVSIITETGFATPIA